MLWTPKAPAVASTSLPRPWPPKLPISLHPSCRLALLPQNDDKWYDYSGHGNHGVIHGATPTARGPDGFAWEFDGVDDDIRTGLTNLSGTDEITVVYRFKGTNIQSMVRQQSGGIHIVIPWGATRRHILSWDGGTIGGVSVDGNNGHTANNNQWHQIGFTWKRNTVGGFRSYFNGLLIESINSANTPIPNTGVPVLLGSRESVDEFAAGLIDYVLVYNQAWSPRPQDANYLPEIDPFLGGF